MQLGYLNVCVPTDLLVACSGRRCLSQFGATTQKEGIDVGD